MSDWHPAYIGLGSNLQDPAAQVRLAFETLEGLPETMLVARSGLFSNPPMGPQNQPDYVNAVAGLLTRLTPADLLDAIKRIESQQGRVRQAGDRWGARIIDLDLLVYGAESVVEPGLTVPHPGIFERNFVLFPLLDIAPQLMVPGQGPVKLLAQALMDQPIERLED